MTIPLGPYNYQVHAHRCPQCAFTWHHDPNQVHSKEQYERAHECPRCHAEQWYILDKGTSGCRWDGAHELEESASL